MPVVAAVTALFGRATNRIRLLCRRLKSGKFFSKFLVSTAVRKLRPYAELPPCGIRSEGAKQRTASIGIER